MAPAEIHDLMAAVGADDAALAVRGLTVSYGDRPVVFSADVTVPKGSMTAIIGPNGAGKSTLLKAVLGIAPRLSGQVKILGRDLVDARAKLAYVPQRASVDWDFPARVFDVVLMGLSRELGLLGRVKDKHRALVHDALTRVGMQDFADRQIGRLSGGQQQRVFLARALVQQADLYVLDEPFAGVDAATERAIIEVLAGLKAEGKTVIAVHHDLSTVRDYFDRVVVMNVRVVSQGAVDDAFTSDALQEAYGGRLATTQIDGTLEVAG